MSTTFPIQRVDAFVHRAWRWHVFELHGEITNTIRLENSLHISSVLASARTQRDIFIADEMQRRVDLSGGCSSERNNADGEEIVRQTVLPPNV